MPQPVTAINGAIDELGNEWTGDAATAFATAGTARPTQEQMAMKGAADGLTTVARRRRPSRAVSAGLPADTSGEPTTFGG